MGEITQDGLNDIRMSLGALVNNVRDLNEKMDDLTALATRSARLSEIADDIESMVSEIPGGLRAAANDPMIGSFLGPMLVGLADDIERAVSANRERRTSAPAIEG